MQWIPCTSTESWSRRCSARRKRAHWPEVGDGSATVRRATDSSKPACGWSRCRVISARRAGQHRWRVELRVSQHERTASRSSHRPSPRPGRQPRRRVAAFRARKEAGGSARALVPTTPRHCLAIHSRSKARDREHGLGAPKGCANAFPRSRELRILDRVHRIAMPDEQRGHAFE